MLASGRILRSLCGLAIAIAGLGIAASGAEAQRGGGGAGGSDGRPAFSFPSNNQPVRIAPPITGSRDVGRRYPGRDTLPPRVRIPPTRPPIRIVCEGGSARGASCICPRGAKPSRIGAGAFACIGGGTAGKTPKRPPVVIVVPPVKPRPPVIAVPPSRPPVIAVPPTRPPVVAVTPPLPPTTLLPRNTPPSPPPQPPVSTARPGGQPLRLPPLTSDVTSVPDEVLASVTPGTPLAVDEQIAQVYGLELLERQPSVLLGSRLLRYRIPDGRSVAAIVAQLASDPRVAETQPNFIYRQQSDPPRAFTGLPQYGFEKISASAAHALSHGRGILVAVIDSAVDTAHPDVAAAVAKSFDAVGDAAAPDSHGTAVAGIIAGRGMVAGIAPEARILAARAFAPGSGRRQGRTTTAVLLRAFDWSATEGARVFNLSFAGPRDPLVHKSLQAATERRIVIVAAAGNGGATAPSAFPAAYEEVIAVTAIDAGDQLYEHANRGPYVSVAAPGVDVLVPVSGAAHDMQSGTSFAAAFASGVAALMLERNPALKATDIKAIVMQTAADLGTPGPDTEFGAGRLNAHASVEQSARRR